MPALRKILNLVDTVSSVNYGIWHAAIATSGDLKINNGVESWLISRNFDDSFRTDHFPELKISKPESASETEARKFFSSFDPEECLVASHGCWQFATRWGAIARSMGFAWVYTPHGMLEPWSMQQKSWKKIPYFHFIEKRLAKKASLVRAVGKPEEINLRKHFPNVVHIPNGIYRKHLKSSAAGVENRNFLFLARLHHKKNVLPLAKAWISISPALRSGSKLRIAGTDDGEKSNLLAFMEAHPNEGLEFLGPVFGYEKEKLMEGSCFYVLPSLSEGFPTSVVEAAGAGLLPLISAGCNFPELLEAGAGIDTGFTLETIRLALEKALRIDNDQLESMLKKANRLIEKEYLWDLIAAQQAREYGRLLDSQKI